MQSVRFIFEKKGDARFISHLDMNRMFARTFKRAEVPIWYTEGFNRHPHIVFSPPLSVGFTSCCEIADIKITEDMEMGEIAERVNKCLPRGFTVVGAYERVSKISDIAYAAYKITFRGENMLLHISEVFSDDEPLNVLKKTKRSESTVNLKELVWDIKTEVENGNTLAYCTLPAGGSLTINPSLLASALGGECLFVERLRFLNESKVEFN